MKNLKKLVNVNFIEYLGLVLDENKIIVDAQDKSLIGQAAFHVSIIDEFPKLADDDLNKCVTVTVEDVNYALNNHKVVQYIGIDLKSRHLFNNNGELAVYLNGQLCKYNNLFTPFDLENQLLNDSDRFELISSAMYCKDVSQGVFDTYMEADKKGKEIHGNDMYSAYEIKVITYESIMEKSKKRKLALDEFEKYFNPLFENDEYVHFDVYEDAKAKALELDSENPYRHVWTCVEGENDSLIALNGWHICNRFYYVVCKTPWGNGNENDANVYIEADYE